MQQLQSSSPPLSLAPPLPLPTVSSTVSGQVASETIHKFDPGSQRSGGGGANQIQPDLSHLTPEERRIIEDVINRQRQEELMDCSQVTLSTPACQVVQCGSKVFQRLPSLADVSPSTTLPTRTTTSNAVCASNAQLPNSIGGPIARAKDEFFGGVTRRGLSGEKPFPSVQHNRTSGDLFGAVTSFFSRTGGGSGSSSDVCEVCHVTKFTGRAGHNCAQCNLKTCVRCGGWFGTQSSWMCKNCFSNLATPPPMSHSAKEFTGSSGRAASSLALARTKSNPRLEPQLGTIVTGLTTTTSSSATAPTSKDVPVERSLSGYAGIAGRTRHRETIKNHRSVSEEERVWPHYQSTPSSHSHPHPLRTSQISHNYYQQPAPPLPSHAPQQQQHPHRQQSYSSIPTRYMQQHSSHYPATTQHAYNLPQLRHSTGPPLGRAYRRNFAESAWAHPVGPPPLRLERHVFRTGDSGGARGETSVTSCGSAEGSPHAGLQSSHRRHGDAAQVDLGSVSEPCQSEAFLHGEDLLAVQASFVVSMGNRQVFLPLSAAWPDSFGDYHKSFTTESRMYQHSIDVDRPSSRRAVFWSLSPDGESLIGQVYLRKTRASSEVGLLSSFGLKLVIGKRVPSDMVGTFVSSVKDRSVADLMGELQIGDEILEWNGHNLRGLHQEEVSEILALSRSTDEVWLTVQRILDDYYEESDGATSSSFSRHGEETKFQEEEEEEEEEEEREGENVESFDRGGAEPHLQLKLRYDEAKQALAVSILAARDLPPQLNTHTWLCNSFCQVAILPETKQYGSCCTRVVRNTNDPVWIHNFTFENFLVSSKELEVAVFDYRQGRTAFIGEVLINLEVADLSGRAYWYPIPPPWDATEQDILSQVQSESGTCEADDWSGEASEQGVRQTSNRSLSGSAGGQRSLCNISPRSVPSHLSASASAGCRQRHLADQRTSRREAQVTTQPSRRRSHAIDRGPRFTLSEDDQSFLSDNSEASGFSSFSKLSLQSNRLRQRQRQRLNTTKMAPSGSGVSPRVSRSHTDCSSPPHDLLVETGEERNEEVEERRREEATRIEDRKKKGREKAERFPDDPPKSSSTEEKSASSSTAAVSASIAAPKTTSATTSTTFTAEIPKSTVVTVSSGTARKRRSSIGHRFTHVLGISKKNTAASATDKKTKASFQRSEEVLPAYIHTNEKGTVSGGYKAPGIVAEGAGFGGIAASSGQSLGVGTHIGPTGYHGSGLQHQLTGALHSSAIATASGRKDHLALEMGEMHVGEFVEGLGPGQLVGRQVLGMPCLGEIQLSFFDRKGRLEVEVIRARGLQQKNTSKPLPTPYVKLHLLEGKQPVEKMRTTAPARRTLDPLFQQQFSFSNSYKDKILQVSVWGEYGRMDKKVFLGMCEIVLDDLNLRSIVFGWYKLFGMIAATAQHHKQVRRQTSSTGASTATSIGTSQTPSVSERRALKCRQPRGKS